MADTPEQIWDQARKLLLDRIDPDQFERWIAPIQPAMTGDALELAVPNPFYLRWIKERYLRQIERCLEESGWAGVVGLVVGSKPTPAAPPPKRQDKPPKASERMEPRAAPVQEWDSGLNPHLTFDRYVTGPSNLLATSAARAVAQQPGTLYNPLFICGPVGMGKTHLISALGNQIKANFPTFRVLYVGAETFFNELVQAIRNNTTFEFKQKYRQMDVLLLDDVHLFPGREGMQQEFFHTFNALYEGKKQIIISSDRYPQELDRLEDRIRSRFAWGLVADVKPAEYETRLAILTRKVDEDQVVIPLEVLKFIALNIKSSVRELEGAYTRVHAHMKILSITPTIEDAKTWLEDILPRDSDPVSVRQIQKVVADYYQVRMNDLVSASRKKRITQPRQVAMFLAKELTRESYPDIGQEFGGRNHATVIHSIRVVQGRIKEDSAFGAEIEQLRQMIIGR
ncbi:MAG: chromosomal replication initiator protein DnaA [Alphaproteobacteria bacterium CG_4_10_14_0_2_um_filter_63_37]|nr:MAG: hypothetical protein AUJ55_00430 [Proteobacteria bacterium CG1_02_64_396]PJA24015.1 MAG: chromosomal replication initiator protein DnaA [Alphaproteobacteria bacterium CG_4_10_14_0_2_um_filter_63_37]